MTTRDLTVEDLNTGHRRHYEGYLFDLSVANAVFTAIADHRPGVVAEGPANCAAWTATLNGDVLIELVRKASASSRGGGPAAAEIDPTHRYRLSFLEF
jgi:hypothetical protein